MLNRRQQAFIDNHKSHYTVRQHFLGATSIAHNKKALLDAIIYVSQRLVPFRSFADCFTVIIGYAGIYISNVFHKDGYCILNVLISPKMDGDTIIEVNTTIYIEDEVYHNTRRIEGGVLTFFNANASVASASNDPNKLISPIDGKYHGLLYRILNEDGQNENTYFMPKDPQFIYWHLNILDEAERIEKEKMIFEVSSKLAKKNISCNFHIHNYNLFKHSYDLMFVFV